LNEEDQIIRLQTHADSLSKALTVLSHFQQTNVKTIGTDTIEFNMQKEQIPVLNNQLVAAGVPVYSIESKRKLEDYFINLIAS
jgi:hypothetical protein